MTVAELRHLLADLPADMEVVAMYAIGCAEGEVESAEVVAEAPNGYRYSVPRLELTVS